MRNVILRPGSSKPHPLDGGLVEKQAGSNITSLPTRAIFSSRLLALLLLLALIAAGCQTVPEGKGIDPFYWCSTDFQEVIYSDCVACYPVKDYADYCEDLWEDNGWTRVCAGACPNYELADCVVVVYCRTEAAN